MMLDRRRFLGHCLGSAAVAGSSRIADAGANVPDRLTLPFHLKETAGLRRFGYPVHAVLPNHTREQGTHYRLLHQGKVVPAQFRLLEPDQREVILAFNASPGPLETTDYTVEFGPSATPGAEPRGGLSSQHDAGLFQIRNDPYLTSSIPEDLSGLISSIRTKDLEYFTPHSRGLFLTDRESRKRTTLKLPRQGGDGSAVWRWQGPISVGLRFTGTVAMPGGKPLRTIVDLSFVNSKSWIETTWTIDDPDDRVGSMGFDLSLLIQGEPALVDCGAGSTVYSHLRSGEVLSFESRPAPKLGESGPRWLMEQGGASGLKPFAVATPTDRAAEGWVHVMDSTRCSAIAVADFARSGPDRFTIEAGGRVELERRFTLPATPDRPKILKFWIHVVPTPVQVGAVTSPQAMLAPLVVDWAG
ncbi:hypothetical protein [Paludisphaera borealis]|nr:hypothetical protein [Paludisphaera borealis]